MPPKPPPTEPTTTHVCPVDGRVRPGKGPYGQGADKCRPCWNDYYKRLRARKREEKWARIKGNGGVVGQIGMNKGHDGLPSTKHGFYRMKLNPSEADLAQELHEQFMAKYELDNLADDLMLQTGIVNFVKSLRKEPDVALGDKSLRGDKNVIDYQGRYERNFRDIMQSLALTRKERKEDGKAGNIADELSAYFKAKVKENQPKP